MVHMQKKEELNWKFNRTLMWNGATIMEILTKLVICRNGNFSAKKKRERDGYVLLRKHNKSRKRTAEGSWASEKQ
jgi:hypothetical protein